MTTHTTSHDAAAALATGGLQILPGGVLAAAILTTGLLPACRWWPRQIEAGPAH